MDEGRSLLAASTMVAAEPEEEDLFVTEPAVSASEDEEDSDGERKHRKLLEAISALGGKKRKKVAERTEAGLQVSEFAISVEGAGKKLRLSDLISPINKTTQLSKVKQQLNKLVETKSVEKPLSKEETEKIQRVISYKKTSEEVAKWQNVVQENRSAEQLVFPLNAQKQKQKPDSLEATMSGWKVSTPLEMEVFSILNRNKPASKPLLTPKEMASLKAMSLEEARERRAELQKARALESYYASKAHREKKIKSKKYHRLLKKVKQKQYLKKFEELRKVDPDAALEELEKLERARIKERMTLKHQSSGKWAKAKAIMAKYDEGARKAIHEQLQRNKELTQKIKVASEDEEEEEKEDEVIPDFVNDAQISIEGANPWMTGKLSSDPGAPAEEETPVDEKMTEKSNDGEEEKEEEEEEEEEEEMEETLLKEFEDRREMRKNPLDPELVPESEMAAAATAGEVSRFNTLFQKMLEQNKKEESGTKGKKRGRSAAVKEPEIAKEQSTTREEEGPLLIGSMERTQTMEDLEALGEQLLDEGPQEPPPKKPEEKKPQPKEKKKSKKSDLIDLENMLPTKTQQVQMPLLPSVVEEEESEHLHEADDSEMRQKMIIKEAFAGDDVIRDFMKEKREAEEAAKPKAISLVLPGWGEWGGTDLKVGKKKRRKFTIKAPPGRPRRDRALPHVIINEKRNIAFAAHQVTRLPFNFSNHKQFESSIRTPVGNTWNTEVAVRKLTAPPVITKRGHIIEPITEDVFKKHNATKKAAAELNPRTDGSQRRRSAAPNPKTKPERRPGKEFLRKKKRKH